MIYVMSDIHGEYEKYIAMLKKINFSKSDMLYILGDVFDRGERPVDVLLDMMLRENVIPILGNHEIIAYDLLSCLSVEITEENYDKHISKELMEKLVQWQFDGGDTTIKQFRKLAPEDRECVLEYLREFSPCEIVDVGEKSFLLVHSGLGNYSPDKDLDDYSLEELAFVRPDYDKKYIDDDNFFIVSGHTPTLLLSGKAEIYKKNNNICIDCGAAFDGKLACLCLDTMEEYYV